MENKIREIFKNYNLNNIKVEEKNESLAFVTLEDDTKLIVKLYEDKEKLGWEYKCIINLTGKVDVPKLYKVNDNYIKEAVVFYKPEGKFIETYEEKSKVAKKLGKTLAFLHISEINEQRSNEELMRVWKKFISNKAIYLTSEITSLFNKDIYDKILNYLTENIKILYDDFELSMIIGDMTSKDIMIDSESNVEDVNIKIINFSNVMIGDPIYDFVKVYNYFYFTKDMIEDFKVGYEDIISIPDNFDEKFEVFLVLEYLERIINSKKDESSNLENKEELQRYIDEIKRIVTK